MKIAVIGCGALGSLFAARLAAVTTVTMVGHWPAQLAAVRRRGVAIRETDGALTQVALPIIDKVQGAGPMDVALVLVKSGQTARAAADCAALLAADGIAVTLQNGMGNTAVLARTLRAARVVQGTTAQGATLEQPGLVRHAGNGRTLLGTAPTQPTLLDALAALCNRAGLETAIVADIEGVVWQKLVVNSAINPLTALLGVRNGALLQQEWTRALLAAVARETAAVAVAAGIQLPAADPAQAAAAVAAATAANRSSMLQDIQRGAPTEIAAICGAIVAAAREAGAPAPLNAQLLALVRQREAGVMLTPAQLSSILQPPAGSAAEGA